MYHEKFGYPGGYQPIFYKVLVSKISMVVNRKKMRLIFFAEVPNLHLSSF
jgi:hypothetical protein